MPNHSIDAFYAPLPTPAPSSAPSTPYKSHVSRNSAPGDGFEPAERLSLPTSPSTFDNSRYTLTKIGSIKRGPGPIAFTGRIANFRDESINSKTANASSQASKLLLRMTLQDETGAIEVRYYMTKPIDVGIIKLGMIVTVHVNFVGDLKPEEKQANPTIRGCFVTLSDTDSKANVEFVEETEDNCDDYKLMPTQTGRIVPLRVYVEMGGEDKTSGICVCVKWVGSRKTISRKDGQKAQKLDIGIFDETAEATLTLWDNMTSSASRTWKASETVLVITGPKVVPYNGNSQLSISRGTLVSINPISKDAQWIRSYAKSLIRKSTTVQVFPGDDIFDWIEELTGPRRIKYTLADLDTFARAAPDAQCVGYLAVKIIALDLHTPWRRNMLLSGTCCGFTSYSSRFADLVCKKCDALISPPIPNGRVFSLLADETGSIAGGQMLWRTEAFENFFGRSLHELAENTSSDVLRYFEQRCAYMQVVLAVGWEPSVGRLAVWDVLQT